MKELDGKEVRFVAVDKRYMRTPYPAIAPHSKSMGTYVTGQHVDPEDETTYGNLTEDEMLGEIEIKPAARKKKFAYVINPDNPVFIIHMQKYNCKVDEKGNPLHPRDYWEAHFILEQNIVANTRRNVKTGKHYFYLEDKDKEAALTVSEFDARYAAEKFIRESLSISDYKDIIELLNLKYPYFQENVKGMSQVRMFETLLKHAHDKPQEIVDISREEAKDELFISKLVARRILKKRVDGIYDGQQLVGRTLDEVILYLHTTEGQSSLEKWGQLLVKAEQKEEVTA